MWTNVASAVVYLLPGFVAYEFIYRRLVPGRRESDLRTTVVCVLWSLIIDAITALLLCGRLLPPPDFQWIDPWVILIQFSLAALTGLGAAKLESGYHLVGWCLRKAGRPSTDYPDVWQYFFTAPEVDSDVVYVRLADGTIYYGAVLQYSDQPDEDPKELLLTQAWFLRDDEAEPIKVRDPVYLRSDAISAIEPTYSAREAEQVATEKERCGDR